MLDPNALPLTASPRAIRDITLDGSTVSYDRLYRAVLSAQIPATQAANGRYTLDRRLLPQIARQLGLPVAAEALT